MPIPITQRMLTPFLYNFPNWSQTTPFTYQDGQTNAKLVESLIKYIDSELVPFVDEEMQRVITAWNETVTQIVNDVINSSVELQDAVVTQIFNDANSLFRKAVNAALKNVIVEDVTDPGTFIIYN